MSGKFGVKIKDSERDTLQELHERINSLKSLVSILSDEKLSIDNENWLKRKLLNDIENMFEEYRNWWRNIANLYNMNKDHIERYSLSFQDAIIYLNEGDL